MQGKPKLKKLMLKRDKFHLQSTKERINSLVNSKIYLKVQE